jgi:two-component system, cell cycle response regulator
MGKKILLIEDDPVSRKLLELVIAKEGFQVITAVNGLEGLKKVHLESPDLLVLDVMLPGLDGFEVCHRLRCDPATEKLPILILSAKGQESDRNVALQVGANAFLPKPIDRLTLLSKMTELPNLSVSSQPEKQVSGDF